MSGATPCGRKESWDCRCGSGYCSGRHCRGRCWHHSIAQHPRQSATQARCKQRHLTHHSSYRLDLAAFEEHSVLCFRQKLTAGNLLLNDVLSVIEGQINGDTLETAHADNIFVHGIGRPCLTGITHFADQIIAPISTDTNRFATATTAHVDPQRCMPLPRRPTPKQSCQPTHSRLYTITRSREPTSAHHLFPSVP